MTLRTIKKQNHLLVTSVVFAITCLMLQDTAYSQGGYPPSYGGQMYPSTMQGMQTPPAGQIQPIFYGDDVENGGNPPPVYGPPATNSGYDSQRYNPEMVFGNSASYRQPQQKKGYTTIPGAFVRLEYIAWDFRKPGTHFLGELRSDRLPLENQIPLSNSPLVGNVLSTSKLAIDKAPGFRITGGLPLIDIGTLEASAFAISQSSHSANIRAVSNSLPATTFKVNGSPSNFAFGYDQGATVTISSRMWGASIALIKQDGPPGEGLKFHPLGGLNYIAIREKFRQVGSYSDPVNVVNSVIEADTINHTIGLMAGARAEFVHRWVTIGVEPKVTLGAGSYRTRVNAHSVLSATDPAFSSSKSGVNFIPILQLGAYLRAHPTENITISAGYDYLATTNIARAHNSMVFDNISGVGVVTADDRFSVFEAGGFNFSLEWIYR